MNEPINPIYMEEARKLCEKFKALRPDVEIIYAAVLAGASIALSQQLNLVVDGKPNSK